MSLAPLLADQPVTIQGHSASLELIVLLQQLVEEIRDLKARVEALEAP